MSRPSDAQDEFAVDRGVRGPQLGPIEWLRWAWRQLTSMRTALLLLLALAIAAVPGSLISQNSSDPNGVAAFKANNPASVVKIVEFFQGFDVYTSIWFSAIYILLFISLVGCVVPRARHHFIALRARPPRTPSRFDRLPARATTVLPGGTEDALAAATRLLRRRRYRVERYGDSVSAERGYLRETGNLLFHSALVGVLITVFIGGGFTFTGQRILAVGQTFVNGQQGYDSLTTGRFFSDDSLVGYSLTLDGLDVKYEQRNRDAFGQPLDYTAKVTTVMRSTGAVKHSIIKVNEPLTVGGTQVYLLGNGYAPVVTVKDATGAVAYSGPVIFRPTEPTTMTSLGVIKAAGTTDPKKQLGFVGFLYPTPAELKGGALTSIYPGVGTQSLLSLNLYVGDLRTDGTPQNVYVLDTTGMKQVAGPKTTNPAIQLSLTNPTATLPDGLGTVHLDGIIRYAGLDIHHDPSQGWVALFVALAVLGLIVSLLVPRRRMWVKVTEEADGRVTVEYAALARGDDPNLDRAVAELERDHRAALQPARESASV